ncbi:Cyclin-D1-binding protein 1 [Desmophyllum pertusum]|uniref:Cyclin-D1-binding protein 1 n=1 Tax=Desmophyllum pertusum TaxID=174260 RepID=A0A9W9ZK34_9CNID|nr:Cyclin-D1-binding protein 1 [Desmophyllum pertusum]
MTFRAVSKEATKLTISFSKPPAPSADELQCLLTGFETTVIAMLTIFRSLPMSQGKNLHKKLEESVLTVVEDCQVLATSFIKEGCSSVATAKTQSTGTLWEHCDGFQHLPKDNKQAVLAVLRCSSELIKDALNELDEAQKVMDVMVKMMMMMMIQSQVSRAGQAKTNCWSLPVLD